MKSIHIAYTVIMSENINLCNIRPTALYTSLNLVRDVKETKLQQDTYSLLSNKESAAHLKKTKKLILE